MVEACEKACVCVCVCVCPRPRRPIFFLGGQVGNHPPPPPPLPPKKPKPSLLTFGPLSSCRRTDTVETRTNDDRPKQPPLGRRTSSRPRTRSTRRATTSSSRSRTPTANARSAASASTCTTSSTSSRMRRAVSDRVSALQSSDERPGVPVPVHGTVRRARGAPRYEDDPIGLGRAIANATPYDPDLYYQRDPRLVSKCVVVRDYGCKIPIDFADTTKIAQAVLNHFPDQYVAFLGEFVSNLFGASMRRFLDAQIAGLQRLLQDREVLNRISWAAYAAVQGAHVSADTAEATTTRSRRATTRSSGPRRSRPRWGRERRG